MTDTSGTVVWSAEYAVFGKATVNEDPDGDGINFTNNLRLPGQYYDLETKKHYNFNRYYDPETGRYISADPIGFAGNDANLYRYVWNQPNSGIDPLGLLNFTFDPDYLVGPQAIYNTGTGLINLFLSKDNQIDPIRIFNLSYTLSIDAGEQYGEEAALYWAQKQVDNRDKWYSPIYAVPGLFASLWTDCTSDATLATLTAAYGAGKYVGRPYYRYVGPKSDPNSPWLTRGQGWDPPYGKNFPLAKDKLQIPNMPNDVVKVDVHWYEPVRGPQPSLSHPEWGSGGGPQYYRGWKVPSSK